MNIMLLQCQSHPLSTFSQITRLAAPPASPHISQATSSPCHSGRNESCTDTLSEPCGSSSLSDELIVAGFPAVLGAC